MSKHRCLASLSDSDNFDQIIFDPTCTEDSSRPSVSFSLASAASSPVNPATIQSPAQHPCHSQHRSHAQSPLHLHYKDWPITKLLKALFDKGINIPVGIDQLAVFNLYFEAISAEPVFPPRLQATSSGRTLPAPQSAPDLTKPSQISVPPRDPVLHLHQSIFEDLKDLIQPITNWYFILGPCY